MIEHLIFITGATAIAFGLYLAADQIRAYAKAVSLLQQRLIYSGVFGLMVAGCIGYGHELSPGVIIDARGAVLAVATLVGGYWVGAATGGVALLARLGVGGPGMPAGLAGIVLDLLVTALLVRWWGIGKGTWVSQSLRLLGCGLGVGAVEAVSLRWIEPAATGEVLFRAAGPDVFITQLVCTLLMGGLIRLQQERRRSRELVQTALATSLDGFVLFGADGQVCEVNGALETMTGYARAELLGMNLAQLQLGLAREGVGSWLAQIRGQGRLRFESRWRSKGGGEIDLEVAATAAPEDIGSIYAFVRDITQRQRAAAALTLAKAQLEDFFNLVPDLVCVASTDGYFKRLNPAWEAALGYSPAQLLAEPIESFLHPEDIAPTRAEVARPLQGQTTVPFRNRYRAKDGTYHWLEWQAAPAAGGLLYAAARDITERKQAEEALRIREEIFSSIVIQAADGILLIDGATGRFVEFNTAAHEDLGYTREQFARLTLADLQTELADERIQEDFRRVRQQGGLVFETRHRCRDGELRDVRVNLRGLRLQGRDYVMAVWGDITERKRAEAALRASEQRVGESERRLAALLSNLPGMAYRCRLDRAWTMEFVSEGCLALTGHPASALTGPAPVSYEELIHPDDREAVRTQVQTAAARRENYQLNYRLQTATGQTKWVWEQGVGIYSPAGELQARDGLILDVTAQKTAEALLAKYQLLSAYANDIFLFIRPEDGRILEANRAACDVYGYDRTELLTKTIHALRADEPPDTVRGQMEQATREGLVFETIHVRRDGRPFPVEVSSRAAQVGGDHLLLSVVRDITQRKQAEVELRKLNRALRARSECGKAMLAAVGEVGFLEQVCRILVTVGAYRLAWVAYPVPDAAKSVRAVAQAGFEDGYLQGLDLTWADTERGHGSTGTCLRTRQRSVHRNLANDPAMAPWRQAAPHRGYAASAAFPLLHGDDILGALIVFATAPEAFDDNEVELLTELASDVAYGIAALRSRAARVRAEESLRESEARMRSLLASMDDLVFVLNRELVFEPYQQPARPELAIQPETFVGKRLDEVNYPEPAGGLIRQAAASTLATGVASLAEYYLDLPQGRVWFDLRVTAFRGADGLPDGVIFVVRNITERKQAEAARIEGEKRFRLLAEGTEDFVTLFDLEWNRLFNSPAYHRRTGWTPADLEAYDFTTRIHPEDVETVKQARAAVVAGQVVTYEHRARCKDGSYLWLETHGKSLLSPEGQLQYFFTAHDITQHKVAQAELRQSEAKFRSIMEASPVPLAVNDDLGNVTHLNPAFLRTFGYHLEDIPSLAQWWTQAYPEPAYRDWVVAEWQRRLARVKSTGIPFEELEVEVRCADGAQRTVMVGMANLPGTFKDLDLVVFYDLTERKQMERQLKQLNAQLEQRVRERTAEALDLYHHAPCGYHSVGPDGVVLQMNETELGWLGYGRAEVEGRRRLSDLMTPASAAAFDACFREFQQMSGRGVWEWDMRCKDGGTITFLVNAEALRDAAGRFVKSRSTVLDITERKRLENRLQESEAKYRVLIESSRDTIIATDAQGRIVDCNPAAMTMFGYPSKQALLDAGFSSLWPARQPDGRDSHACFGEKIQTLLANGKDFFEWTHQRPDGTLFPAEVSASVCILNGQQAFMGIVRDISERKAAEAQLRASETKFRQLIEKAPLPLVLFSQAGAVQFVNERFTRLLGYTLEDMPTAEAWWPRAFPNADYQRQRTEWLAAAARVTQEQGDIPSLELQVTGKTGQVFTMLISGAVFPSSLLVVFQDITGVKLADQKLRQLSQAVEVSPSMIQIADVLGRVEYVNPSWEKVTGYRLAEVLGQKPTVLKSGQHSLEFYRHLWGEILAGRVWRGEFCNRKKNGELYWESAAIAPLQNEAGVTTHFVAVKEDITKLRQITQELHQAKEAAEAANRAKSTFLANMSHEIRTPMNGILGFAQLMQRDPSLSAAQRQRLDTINRSGEHLLRLISDILDMSKIESGRMNLALGDCDFGALLADLEAMFRSRVEEKGLHLEVQRAADLPSHLHTDAGRVRQVLINILGNAVKFTAQGDILLEIAAEPVAANPAAVRLCFEVTDTGSGIAPEELGQVFGAFAQTQSGQRHGGGTGLGMAISRELARKLGGDVTVVSQLGVGSTFRFTFVAAVVPSASGVPALAASARQVIGLKTGGPPPTALVVDDTESNRELLRDLLEAVGFVVREAADGSAVLAACAAQRPDLVLMDKRMPGLDGLAATRALRASPLGRDARILIISADALGTSETEWRSAGADGFIAKPFRNEELLGQIGALLGLEPVYAAPPAAAVPRPVLAAEAVAQLADGVRAEMVKAVEVGDLDRLLVLVARDVVPLHPALGQALNQLAASFDYDTLLQALKREEQHD